MGFYKSAKDFLTEADLYQLGHLPTEQPHAKTNNLSELACSDLPTGFKTIFDIDKNALSIVSARLPQVDQLRQEVQETMASGGKVYLCGCGATGRLSLTIETLWRQQNPENESVVAFMAGGDVALVHSLEGFEDFPEYGERHLKQLGFGENDLLISSTEGGETPYVIGATEAAAKISKRSPYFLYCNPDKELCDTVLRSKKIIENSSVQKINLHVGPMALAGSTRMQASTVLQLAVGLAVLENAKSMEEWSQLIEDMKSFLDVVPLDGLAKFTELEAATYANGDYILYKTDEYGITVFTDTTERSPTFSLSPFQNSFEIDESELSLSYVAMENATTPSQATFELLRRKPRSLNWLEVTFETSDDYFDSFDFSLAAGEKRLQKLSSMNKNQVVFHVHKRSGKLMWQIKDATMYFTLVNSSLLYEHLVLKMMLNAHSTLLMGRLGRYESNIMTWVTPTNGKLIDRAARYIAYLLELNGHSKPYESVVEELFKQIGSLEKNESVVLKTFKALKG